MAETPGSPHPRGRCREPAPACRHSRTRRLGLAAGFLLLVPLLPGAVRAQEGAVVGRVSNASTLEAVDGAQVTVEGTQLGALTDSDGRYRIDGVPAGLQTVRVRLIGFRPESRQVRVEPGEVVTADVEISVSAVAMDELVVTATGEVRSREVGVSVSTIDSDAVEKSQAANFTDLLQGRSTGVSVRRNSGSVGAGSSLKIRGNSSIDLDMTPIVYVDGARIDNNNGVSFGAVGLGANASTGGQDFTRLNDLSPEDIESVEIIKGPAAATLYGTEAAGGVIRITTKKGSGTDARYTFRVQQGANWDATDWWNMAWNPSEEVFNFSFIEGAPDTVYTVNLLEEGPFHETPWRTGHLQTYGASVRGGLGEVDYFLSGEFTDQQGVTPSNEVQRWTARGNFAIRPSDKIEISVSNGFISSQALLPESDNSLFSIVGNALGFPEMGRVSRADPNAGGEPIETCFLAFELARATGDPLADLTEAACIPPFFAAEPEKILDLRNGEEVERYTGSVNLTYRPVERWSNRFTVGYDEHGSKLFDMFPVDPARPFGEDSDGFLFRRNSTSRNLTLEATSSYDLDLTEDVGLQTTVGGQFFRQTVEATDAIGRVFPAGAPAVNNAVTNEGSDFFIEERTAGFFLQERISWKDRVFLTPGVRFDDNSAFGDNLGLQVYPQVQASWVVSDEAWSPGFFQQLKLRGAWGESGKQPGPNDALALLAPTAVSRDGENVLGITADQPGNPDLSPETSSEFEVGLEASVLGGRLTADFTYYDQTTENAITEINQPLSLGFPDNQFTNIGKITNSGIELALDGVVVERRSLVWSLRGQLTTVDSEILELRDPIVFGSQRHAEGFAFGSYFAEEIVVEEVDGERVGRVLTCEEDPTGCLPDEGSETGFAGNARFQGQPTPEWEGSLSSTLTLLGHITLYGLLDFAGGHHLENGLDDFSCAFAACPNVLEKGADGEFTDDALRAREAALIGSEDPFIEEADFAKLRSVSVRFDAPGGWARFLRAQNASLTVAAENLATWTDYSGTDPEVNFAGSSVQATRAQLWTIPPARRVTAQLSFTF